jgi:hypothetical protein
MKGDARPRNNNWSPRKIDSYRYVTVAEQREQQAASMRERHKREIGIRQGMRRVWEQRRAHSADVRITTEERL